MKNDVKDKWLHVRITSDVKDKIIAYTKTKEMTVSEFITNLIEREINKLNPRD